MSSLMKQQKQEEKNKRFLFLGVTGTGVALFFLFKPFLGALITAGGLYLGWQWLKYRAKNGMRF